MRGAWAVLGGIALGIGVAWWLAREDRQPSPGQRQLAEQAAADQASEARPSLYRWRDAAGVLQITEQPPEGRPFERIDLHADPAIQVRGDRSD